MGAIFPHMRFLGLERLFELFGKNKNCFYLQKEKKSHLKYPQK